MPTETIRSTVTGVTFRNSDGANRQELIRRHCRPGTPLLLIPERRSTAIGVWIVPQKGQDRVQIGVVNETVRRRLAKGGTVSASVLKLKGGGDRSAIEVEYEIQVEGGKAKSKIGCGGCLAVVLVAVAIAIGLSAFTDRKRGDIDVTPKPVPPLAETPESLENTVPAAVDAPPTPLIEETPEPDPEPVGPPEPRSSPRAATMLQSSRNIEKLGNRQGAIASYRDVAIMFPGTIEAAEALAELKRLGGEPPSPEEIKAAE